MEEHDECEALGLQQEWLEQDTELVAGQLE